LVEAAPSVREEDGVLIVPVIEERLVVTTELVLKEVIRITKKSRTEIVREPVRLRSERVEIERLQGRDLNNPNVEERDSDGRSNPDRDV
jgi:predicted nucleic acid-binding protein